MTDATFATETVAAAKPARKAKIANPQVRAIVAEAIKAEKKAEARTKAIRKSYALKGVKERHVAKKKAEWVAGKILQRRAAKEAQAAA